MLKEISENRFKVSKADPEGTGGCSETGADRRRELLGGSGHTPPDLFLFFIFRTSKISFPMISRAGTFINQKMKKRLLINFVVYLLTYLGTSDVCVH